MKKLICILLLVCMTSFASADSIDLSGMSFDELFALRETITAEIMTRPEWKEVKVPAGTWIIGKDIPAGCYCIKAETGKVNVSVWRKEPQDYSNNGLVYNELISPESAYGRMELKEGWIFEIGKPVIFTPPISLGF